MQIWFILQCKSSYVREYTAFVSAHPLKLKSIICGGVPVVMHGTFSCFQWWHAPVETSQKSGTSLTHTAFGLLVFQLKVMHKFTNIHCICTSNKGNRCSIGSWNTVTWRRHFDVWRTVQHQCHSDCSSHLLLIWQPMCSRDMQSSRF